MRLFSLTMPEREQILMKQSLSQGNMFYFIYDYKTSNKLSNPHLPDKIMLQSDIRENTVIS